MLSIGRGCRVASGGRRNDDSVSSPDGDRDFCIRESGSGPTRTSAEVRFSAAILGMADVEEPDRPDFWTLTRVVRGMCMATMARSGGLRSSIGTVSAMRFR